MKKLNLTTKLNLKIICVILLFTILTILQNYLLETHDENTHNINFLNETASFLAPKKPTTLFTDVYRSGLSEPDQLRLLHDRLQPIVSDVFTPLNTIKYGFFSCKYNRIVALGPSPDDSLFTSIESRHLDALCGGDLPLLSEEPHSFPWYGAEAITYSIPLFENGIKVGSVFATVNQSLIQQDIRQKSLKSMLYALLMLMLCIVIFRDIFVKFKVELQRFAESFSRGNSSNYQCEISELTPVLKLISEQSERLAKLDRLNMIGEMSAGIAHEIRNPMTTVRGLLQYLGAKEEFKHNEQHFQLMIAELDRANAIISTFLSLSKSKVMDFHPYSLTSAIRELLPLLHTNVTYRNSQLKTLLSPTPEILLDKSSICQVIVNMVQNSLDAMPYGGIISIEVSADDSAVVLKVSDSGHGISADVIKQLGTPFFTTKDNGTGLGLAICYQIIRRHHAVINCDSSPVGTTFTCLFPLMIGTGKDVCND